MTNVFPKIAETMIASALHAWSLGRLIRWGLFSTRPDEGEMELVWFRLMLSELAELPLD